MSWKLFALALAVCTLAFACTPNEMARNYGGKENINLPCGQKLENVTWKELDIWYLTRPMLPFEEPTVHTFQEKSVWGKWEGTLTIYESRCGG